MKSAGKNSRKTYISKAPNWSFVKLGIERTNKKDMHSETHVFYYYSYWRIVFFIKLSRLN